MHKDIVIDDVSLARVNETAGKAVSEVLGDYDSSLSGGTYRMRREMSKKKKKSNKSPLLVNTLTNPF